MEQSSYPPPPPQEAPFSEVGLHGPRTSLFPHIRTLLAAVETPTGLFGNKSPTAGLLVCLIISAVAGFGLSYAVQIPLLSAFGIYALAIVFAPLTEEIFKTSGMLVVAYLMWKTIPNRRYGAALGAAAGLGFGILESLLYIYGIATTSEPAIAAARIELIMLRALLTLLMHPLWSAFVGIGVFALLSGMSRGSSFQKPPSWLPWFFLLLGMANHLIWNGISFGLADFAYLPIFLNVIVTFPVFAIVLRDFLGGHFNFQNFFKPLTEPTTPHPTIPPPPPPPPQTP